MSEVSLSERVIAYLSDERHVYKGARHTRRQSAIADVERLQGHITTLRNKLTATSDILTALKRLDTSTTYKDSHSPYYTFNEDDAIAIRAAIAKAEANEQVDFDAVVRTVVGII